MNFDPQKFFIGLTDFFSIVLPGALFTWLLLDVAGPGLVGKGFTGLSGARDWVTFLFASYLFGHLVFLAGSWLDQVYDRLRRRTLDRQIALMAHHGRLEPRFIRVLVWLLFKDERNRAVERAASIKRRSLADLQAADAINTFQWCKALLNASSPASFASVQRFEADSKFFRCLAVVLIAMLAVALLRDRWPDWAPLALLGLLLLALWRYMDQRLKATNQAYWSVITLTAKEGKLVLDRPAPEPGRPTHAGGVVFRMRAGVREYLLVEATQRFGQWVLPKGHLEDREHPREAAVREVREETGVWARIQRELRDVAFTTGGTPATVRFFLMEALELPSGRPRQHEDRRHAWLPLEQAVAQASHVETRELLQRVCRAEDRHDAALLHCAEVQLRRPRTGAA